MSIEILEFLEGYMVASEKSSDTRKAIEENEAFFKTCEPAYYDLTPSDQRLNKYDLIVHSNGTATLRRMPTTSNKMLYGEVIEISDRAPQDQVIVSEFRGLSLLRWAIRYKP